MADYIVVSFSGGKDSTAMLLRMIELGEHIDEVICCDTYKEFPAMYRHIERVKKVVEAAGIKFTVLRADKSFDYYMFEYNPKRKNKKFQDSPGYGWAFPVMRWCTVNLKQKVINQYFKSISSKYRLIECIGIAADEQFRIERAKNIKDTHRHPLIEWGWDEKTCLQYCYDHGYDWEGLYQYFSRVSCWCCPLKSLPDSRNLWRHFPELWEELEEMDRKAWNQFHRRYSVQDLEKRFEFEDALTERGLPITDRAFHADLKRLLEGETTLDEILEERKNAE